MQILKNILQLILLPLIIAGAFFFWSLPRITSDYNFNSDELVYLSRQNYYQAFIRGDFRSPLWSSWGAYDQPQLANYVYAQVPGDRDFLTTPSPCTTQPGASIYALWSCLDGSPLDSWPAHLAPLRDLLIRGRTVATGISAIALATTYYLGYVIAGPLAGVLAAFYLGYYSFFQGLSTMVMTDQLLLLFLNLQVIMAVLIARRPTLVRWGLLSLVTGLAISTKLTALLPSTIFTLLLSLKLRSLSRPFFTWVIAASVFFILHPPLWTHPLTTLVEMYSWRSSQLTTQSSPLYLPTNLFDRAHYTLKEVFASWDHQANHSFPLFMALCFFLGSALLIIYSGHRVFATFSLLSIFIFTVILPIKWNRYLLPILPTIAVTLGTLPLLISQFIHRTSKLITQQLSIPHFTYGSITALLLFGVVMLFNNLPFLPTFIVLLTLVLFVQGFVVTRAMLYGFSHRALSLTQNTSPSHTYSLIVPARDEAAVIGATITSLAQLDYPSHLYEVLVLVRADDAPTLQAAQAAISRLHASNIRLIPIDGEAFNKAYSLNLGIHLANHDYIGIFDAEDEPHPQILRQINNHLCNYPHTQALQAPVHLTNLTTPWFAGLNAVEYYYWFRSVLPYLSTKNIVPLAGNTVFLSKTLLQQLNSYDETCLTEDADLGIRLARARVPVHILTDPSLATKEETPADELGVIRQRSRWDQGYYQVLAKQSWRSLDPHSQIFALYTLTQPFFRHLSFLNMVFSPLLASTGTIPLAVALFSFLPSYFLAIQLSLYVLGYTDLARLHAIKLKPWHYIKLLLSFLPYQALLALGTFRALWKIFLGNYSWDKTAHSNAHRSRLAILNS